MKGTEITISLTLKRSRWMAVYVLLVYAGSAAALWYLPLTWGWKCLGSLLLLACGYRSWRSRMSPAVVFLVCDRGAWTLVRKGVSVPIELRSLTIWPWLVVLNYQLHQCRWQQSLVLFPDSAEAGSLRQLRVILRHMPL